MKEKRIKCLYCDGPMDPKTTRAVFCSDKCRVYFARENGAVPGDSQRSGNGASGAVKKKSGKKERPKKEDRKKDEDAPETFAEFLKVAEGLRDKPAQKEDFKKSVRESKLGPNQKAAVFARLVS